jgi:DNA phosphorothioation-dependent restriction protein DptG
MVGTNPRIRGRDVEMKAFARWAGYADISQLREIGRKEGIKEVVDWIDSHVYWRTDAPYKSTIDPEEWQAKKKEWGIEKNKITPHISGTDTSGLKVIGDFDTSETK